MKICKNEMLGNCLIQRQFMGLKDLSLVLSVVLDKLNS